MHSAIAVGDSVGIRVRVSVSTGLRAIVTSVIRLTDLMRNSGIITIVPTVIAKIPPGDSRRTYVKNTSFINVLRMK